MRFHDFDPKYSIVRLGDGRPIKVDAVDAARLPDGAYEFNEVLFNLLCTAFENDDHASLERLWLAAHKYVIK